MCEKLPCVCDICNCGRHKCPHKLRCPGPWDKCTLSEYNRQFIPHEICPPESHKPSYRPILGEGPLSKDTTNRVDYIPYNIEPPKPFKPAEYVKPEGHIDDMTMYRKEFGPKESCPPIQVRPAPARPVPAKFQGETTNRNDFRLWDLPERHSHKPESFQPCTDKFEGIGSYNRDYIPHCVAPTQSCRPVNTFMQSTEPMSQDTDYRDAYILHPLEPRPSKKTVCYTANRAPLDTMTTHKKEFTPKEICKVKSCKPGAFFSGADQPLSSETTHRTDYRNTDPQKPYKHDPGKYVKPEGDMDLKTTYNNDFIDLPACKVYAVEPPAVKRISAPFQGTTMYRDTYIKYDIPPVKPVIKDCYQPNTDPFDDCTTSKAAFVPHEICRVKSFKPPPHYSSGEPFDDATMYRTEYTKKNQPCCPAMYLNTNVRSVSPDGYVYHCEDNRGHLHYRRGSVPALVPLVPDQNINNSNEVISVDKKLPIVLPPLEA